MLPIVEVAMTKPSFGIREAMILALIVAVGVLAWRTSAIARERDDMSMRALAERQARAATELSLNALKYQLASGQLNSDVHQNIIDSKIADAQKRAAELEHQAESLRQEKVREANCVTPKSIRDGTGL
jgi:ABC-type phosphate transport system auxiliary subunit